MGPGEIFGGVANDGGGWIVVNGRIHRVPPRSPVLVLLEQLSRLEAASRTEAMADRTAEVDRVYRSLATMIGGHVEDLDELHTPPLDALDGRFDGFEGVER